MKTRKRIETTIEDGGRVLDPLAADPRFVAPENVDSAPPPPHKRRERAPKPAEAEVRPTPKELGKEHRGY